MSFGPLSRFRENCRVNCLPSSGKLKISRKIDRPPQLAACGFGSGGANLSVRFRQLETSRGGYRPLCIPGGPFWKLKVAPFDIGNKGGLEGVSATVGKKAPTETGLFGARRVRPEHFFDQRMVGSAATAGVPRNPVGEIKPPLGHCEETASISRLVGSRSEIKGTRCVVSVLVFQTHEARLRVIS